MKQEIKIGFNGVEAMSFIEFCINQHDVICNQKYDKLLPYSQHLKYVEAQYKLFNHLINDKDLKILQAIYGHDLIEDARVSYNDIKERVGVEVAEMIFLCTENKGRTRDERKNILFYIELSGNENAVFVKLCDLIANVKYSMLTNSSMFTKYESEYNDKVRKYLYIQKYDQMFKYLDRLFGTKHQF